MNPKEVVDPLAAWVDRNTRFGEQLTQELNSREVFHDLGASQQIAHWAYSQVQAAGGLTWVRGKELVPLSPGWESLL